jgi:hypothetical protein
MYKICPFGEAKQNHVLVGKWRDWGPRPPPAPPTSTPPSKGRGGNRAKGKGKAPPPDYRYMYFGDGAKCYNGPKR